MSDVLEGTILVYDKVVEIIDEAGDRDGIPGLYTIEEAANKIIELLGAEEVMGE